MKTSLFLAYLLFACLSEAAETSSATSATGGLADIVLSPSDIEGHCTRRVMILVDPKASPPEIFQVNSNSQRSVPKQMEAKRAFHTRGLALVGAEAEMLLEYYDPERGSRFSLHIFRYPTTQDMDSMWKRLQKSRGRNVKTVSGEEVIYTSTGQDLSEKLRTEQPSVEAKQGKYHIMLSPGEPKEGDPGLNLMRKQVEKIKKAAETNRVTP